MAWRCGSVPRSLISFATASVRRSALPLRVPPPPPPLHGLRSRLVLSSIPRTTSELGCIQSLLPLHSVVAAARLTSHIAVQASTCCELSQGIVISTLSSSSSTEPFSGVNEWLCFNSKAFLREYTRKGG
ncbi:protein NONRESPONDING TO OXYLIPINS 2, mitochondrial-like [Diospyros lotus]|uniref:protein NONRESPONDING TO OXYLIPINS 2, mitochondrial-like n=1 Tax=Diospyros lotus TaxID=55363 RepID=UPI0022587A3B|nr:protein NONRESPONDING TO OXYLIPINS 2, mitochondrial-like [Diospyros lotus]